MDERDDLTGAGAGRRGDRRARPRDNPTTVFADADGRTAHLEVVVLLRVQLGDLLGRSLLLEVDQRLCGSATRVVPALEGGEHDRSTEGRDEGIGHDPSLAGPSWLGRPSVVYVQVRVRFWRDDLYY